MGKKSSRKNLETRKSMPGHRLNKQERIDLKNKRRNNLLIVRQAKNEMDAPIPAHTNAHNRKSQAQTTGEEQKEYEAIMGSQLKTWRVIFPSLLKKLSKIKDPRNPGKIKHTKTVVMFYGLLLFLFRIQSKREFNKELTTPTVLETLNKIFPEIDTIPHADTISRFVGRIELNELESIHVEMVKELINQKKFNKLFIDGCLPISIDGTQKAVRDGQLQEEGWLLRTINTKEGKKQQQYVYVLEANITFHNGLSIPFLTEFCYLDIDSFDDELAKQDCELNGFKRLADKLKKYFPRRKMIILLDNLYANENVIATLKEKNWEFMIKLPAKLKTLYHPLAQLRDDKESIPWQPYYRERGQSFHWINNMSYHGHTVHVVACNDQWPSVALETSDIVNMRSEHTWISSQPLSINNVHLLCNLAARKRGLIEDSFNTEKNRGYQYQHLFSYHWSTMRGLHLLMRLAHAINALSEYTKNLKKYIRDLGCANTFKKIFAAIKHPWLSEAWFEEQLKKEPSHLHFDFE